MQTPTLHGYTNPITRVESLKSFCVFVLVSASSHNTRFPLKLLSSATSLRNKILSLTFTLKIKLSSFFQPRAIKKGLLVHWRLARCGAKGETRRIKMAEYCYTRGIDSVPFEERSGRCNCELRFCFNNRATTRMTLGKITEAYYDCVQVFEINLGYIKNHRVTDADCQLALEEADKASSYYSAQSDGIDSKKLVEPREGCGKTENGVKIPCIEPQNFLSKELHSAIGSCAMNFPLIDAFMPPTRWNNGAKVVPSNDAVVKVFCTHSEPNFSLPWQMKRQYSSTSSGFVISGRRVLTNAHSVYHYTQVKLKKRSSDTKYIATVLAIGNECDIAMLTVNDDEFWEDIQPVEFGLLPAQQDAVTVVGYPMGGDNISVTSGVVSRIEIFSYLHGSAELLGLQVDAAINSGNSGGPVFNNKGQCVGIAFQKGQDADNIGYVIPTPVIMHFIADYEKFGQYTGFPILGIAWQDMENPDLRKAMGMKSYQNGIRVRRVEPTASVYGCLKPSDIILSFDGVDIANDGTVPFMHGERIGFSYLVSQKYTGEKAVITVLRDSKVFEFTINLGIHKRLIPTHINGRPPYYYIVAGFVFTYITIPYLDELNTDTPVKLLDKQLYAMAQSEDEELVVVSQVLAADINVGYEYLENIQVISFNSKHVKNLKGLVQMVEECNEEFLKFDLEHQGIVVLETKRAKEATHDILKANFIPSAMSGDLKAEIN